MAPPLQIAGADAWWWRLRARLCLYTAAALIGATWLVSYAAWLAEGCMRFLPFISDFGLEPHRRCFSVGMSAAAVLLMPCWFDYRAATAKYFEHDGRGWQWLHWSTAPLGLWCSAAILCVVAYPEDHNMFVHCVSAFALFIGSVLFGTLTTVLDARRGLPYHVSLIVFFVSFFALIAGTSCIIKSVMLWREPGRIEMAKEQDVTFRMYCSGQQILSLHYDYFGNLAAVFEWMLLLNVTGLAFYKMHAAIDAHSDCGTDFAARQSSSRSVDAGTTMTPRDPFLATSMFVQAYGSCKGP